MGGRSGMTRRSWLFATLAAPLVARRKGAPGAPTLAVPVVSGSSVQFVWTAPQSVGSSPLTGFNIYVDGKKL